MLQLEIEALKAKAPGVVPGGIDPAAIVADAGVEPGPEAAAERSAETTDAAADASTAGPPAGA